MSEYRDLKTIEDRIEYILNIDNYKAKGYLPVLEVYQEAANRIKELESRVKYLRDTLLSLQNKEL